MFRPLFFLAASAFALALSAPAFSKTYYVDSQNGSDQWTGTSPSPLNGDGPWLTVAKVSAQILLPGDGVLLKCGGSWNQTLAIKSSGTASSPITYGVYPTGCTTPPQIKGATAIPASNWKQYSGNIYMATLPLNLISNSTFDSSVSGWTTWSQNGDATVALATSCQTGNGNCLSFTSRTTGSSAISNNFALTAGTAYSLKFAANIPSGKTIWASVRRAVSPYDTLGLAVSITGNGTWQSYSFPLSATALANARLDIWAPAGMTVRLDNVRVDTTLGGGLGIFDNGRAINVAHHPNRGYDPLHPASLYYSIAQDSAQTVVSGKTVSTYLTTGADLQLPSGAMLTPGTGIRIRSNNWAIDERKIASVSGSQINLDQPTDYPLYKDWGYFLTGQLWMLDEPGESLYDAASNTVYVWMSDSAAPGDRVSVGQLGVGIDIGNVSYVTVEGIAVRNSGTGVRMNQANNVALRNIIVEDVLGRGVDANQSAAGEIGTSRFSRTGKEAISGANAGYDLSNFSVHDNDISQIGVVLNGNVITSLPANIRSAIHPGVGATVTRNRISGTSLNGIMPLQNSVISDNYIENTCLVLDDCAGIYNPGLGGTLSTSLIDHNTVVHVVGAQAGGKPTNYHTPLGGIYMDELTTGVTVTNNTIVDSLDGIFLHNAANNHVQGNVLYGNRRYNLLLQEDTNKLRSGGDLYGNVVNGNQFFQTGSYTSIFLKKAYGSPASAAGYDTNLYFTLVSPRMASEQWSTSSSSYDFAQWQAATTSSGAPRNLDPLGSEVNSGTIGYATYKVSGSNIVPNGNLASGGTGWSSWNQTAPYGQLNLINCAPGKCLQYVAGGSIGWVSSPNFSVVQGQWYRVSFDVMGSASNQSFSALVQRGGGGSNGYEALMKTAETFGASTAFRRFSFIFQSLKTVNANDPVTGDKGARVSLFGVQSITVTNLELLPISSIQASLRTNILVNPTGNPVTLDCPLTGTDASSCGEFVRFTDAQPVIWPYPLAPRNSEIIYTRDSTLVDGDGDGISDIQDTCPSTLAGQSVNAQGCAFNQSYP